MTFLSVLIGYNESSFQKLSRRQAPTLRVKPASLQLLSLVQEMSKRCVFFYKALKTMLFSCDLQCYYLFMYAIVHVILFSGVVGVVVAVSVSRCCLFFYFFVFCCVFLLFWVWMWQLCFSRPKMPQLFPLQSRARPYCYTC